LYVFFVSRRNLFAHPGKNDLEIPSVWKESTLGDNTQNILSFQDFIAFFSGYANGLAIAWHAACGTAGFTLSNDALHLASVQHRIIT